MVKIELMDLTGDIARYKYYPETSKEYGIIVLDRKTGERKQEKSVEEFNSSYAAHAIWRIEEYQETGKFLEKDIIAWY